MKVRTCGVLVECGDEILILKRRTDYTQGGKWGLPAGRPEEGETDVEAAVRELYEETGFSVRISEVEFVKGFEWNFTGAVIIFILFRVKVPEKFGVRINPEEHIDYRWITPKECHSIENPIHGLRELLEDVYGV